MFQHLQDFSSIAANRTQVFYDAFYRFEVFLLLSPPPWRRFFYLHFNIFIWVCRKTENFPPSRASEQFAWCSTLKSVGIIKSFLWRHSWMSSNATFPSPVHDHKYPFFVCPQRSTIHGYLWPHLSLTLFVIQIAIAPPGVIKTWPFERNLFD